MKVIGQITSHEISEILGMLANGVDELLIPVRTSKRGVPIVAQRDDLPGATLVDVLDFIGDLVPVILDIRPRGNLDEVYTIAKDAKYTPAIASHAVEVLDYLYLKDPDLRLGMRETQHRVIACDKVPWNVSFVIVRDGITERGRVGKLRKSTGQSIEVFIQLDQFGDEQRGGMGNDGIVIHTAY